MIVCVGMKLQRVLIDLQIDQHGIIGSNLDASIGDAHADVFALGRDVEILRSIKTLQKINDKPAEEVLKEVDAKKEAAKS